MSVSGTLVTTYYDGFPKAHPSLQTSTRRSGRGVVHRSTRVEYRRSRPTSSQRVVGSWGTQSLPAAHESLATRVLDPTLSTAERAGGVGGALGNPSSYVGTGVPATDRRAVGQTVRSGFPRPHPPHPPGGSAAIGSPQFRTETLRRWEVRLPRRGTTTRGPRSTTMSAPTEAPRPKAVLVGVQLPGVTDADQRSSLKELKRLCETLGFEVVGEMTQKRQGLGATTLLGEGKLAELAAWTGGTGVVPKGPPEPLDLEAPPAPTGEPRATVVVIDHELSPRQLRSIKGATSAAEVLDRTGVIIEIFHRHASSRPARLQVEIARLTYVAPRLRETGGGERQRGGIGLRGAGESSGEVDRRKIRRRISALKTAPAAI